jgi:hypothetical protein
MSADSASGSREGDHSEAGTDHVGLLPSAGGTEAELARDAQVEREADAALDDFEHRAAADLEAILRTDLMEIEHEDAPSELEPGGGMVPRQAAAASSVTPEQAGVASDSAAAALPATGASAPGPDVEVECPGCGLVVVGSDPRASAEWFCPRCDYPLFFAVRPAPPEPDAARRGARRRLPGVKGRASSTAGPCWNCSEWNEAGVAACLRCAATLPKPVPPRPGPFETFEAPEPELVEVEVLYWPPIVISVVGGFLAGVAFLVGLLMLMDRW